MTTMTTGLLSSFSLTVARFRQRLVEFVAFPNLSELLMIPDIFDNLVLKVGEKVIHTMYLFEKPNPEVIQTKGTIVLIWKSKSTNTSMASIELEGGTRLIAQTSMLLIDN